MATRSCLDPGECRTCKKPILWCVWTTGKKMPIDLESDPRGNLVATYRKSKNELLVDKYDEKLHAGRNTYVSHFKTCPDQKDWRKKK